MTPSELRLYRAANLGAPRPIRHALAAFLDALEFEPTRREDILLAVGEALSNAVEHAYPPSDPGVIEVHALVPDGRTLTVEVADRGAFVPRDGSPNRGFGLRIMRAIASHVTVETGEGTRVSLTFEAPAA
jgi:anti-sigma regulatory factor (Ser/Thr protein kinase)